jgi:small subunit ribosomal protein S4
MARYTGAVCRLCRREGTKLYLKGDRCYSDKCAFITKQSAPGQHGTSRKKVSEYGMQLREKQKAKRIYGVQEKQFRIYYHKASRMKGVSGANLLILLERRLDNAVYRLGLASSRVDARQLVRHGHFTVDGHKVNIPSFLVKEGQVISVREGSRKSPKFEAIAASVAHHNPPAWLELDKENLVGKIIRLPGREDIELPINEQLIIELYSR